MTRTVLLTGATGFVGCQILDALSTTPCRLRIVARPGKRIDLPAGARSADILQTPDLFSETSEWLAAACEGVDVVVHAAWYTEPGKYLQSSLNLDCLAGTLSLAKAAAAAKAKRFVGVGTCFEYDVERGVLSQDTPLKPTTPYAAAKAAAYLALSQWLPQQSVEFAWCRLFYLYGDGEDDRRLIAYIRSRLSTGQVAHLTHGAQVRDFLDVREAGRRIADIALGNRQGAVNICSGVPITIRELAERVADEFGRRDLLRFGSRPINVFDPPCIVGADDARE